MSRGACITAWVTTYPFCALELCKLPSAIHLHTRSEDLDLVRVHRCRRVCSNGSSAYSRPRANLHVFAMRIFAFSRRLGQLIPIVLSRMKPFFVSVTFVKTRARNRHTFIKIRVCQFLSDLLDNLNMVQIRRALKRHSCGGYKTKASHWEIPLIGEQHQQLNLRNNLYPARGLLMRVWFVQY